MPGGGYFPTEYKTSERELLKRVQSRGKEIGTTTGRVRRCGHLDLVALRYACKMSGVTSLALTHFDVFDDFEQVYVCTGYEIGSKIIHDFPTVFPDQRKIQPVLKKCEGWKVNTLGYTEWDQLNENARAFVSFIEDYVEVPIDIISTGPERLQVIVKNKKWNNLLGLS